MELNLIKDLKKNIESNTILKKFIKEINEYVEKNIEENSINKEKITKMSDERIAEKRRLVEEYRKEGHIYLVTEDRGNKIYLWDYTEKPDFEVEEFELPEETLKIAHEGTMLKYENGKYILYSKKGYDELFDEKNT